MATATEIVKAAEAAERAAKEAEEAGNWAAAAAYREEAKNLLTGMVQTHPGLPPLRDDE